MPHRTEPRRLVVPYGFVFGTGVLLTLYQPPSVERLASDPLVTVWHVVLLGSAVLALIGATTRREVIEAAGATVMCGPYLAYVVILGLAGNASQGQGRFATWGIACSFLALVSLLAGRAAWLWGVIRAARNNHNTRRRSWI